MKPHHFLNDGNFLLVCDDGKVLHKSELERVLKVESGVAEAESEAFGDHVAKLVDARPCWTPGSQI